VISLIALLIGGLKGALMMKMHGNIDRLFMVS
jgi:hypothetical protein